MTRIKGEASILFVIANRSQAGCLRYFFSPESRSGHTATIKQQQIFADLLARFLFRWIQSRLRAQMVVVIFLSLLTTSIGSEPPRYDDPLPRLYHFTARASEIDVRVKPHPEIGFLIDTEQGKPADIQHAIVDTRVAPRGRLVIWLMGYNKELFERLSSYGMHAIRVHYANQWFSLCCQESPVDEHCRGNIRLEAATGEDFSDQVAIPTPDGMAERAYQFVLWLNQHHPEGNWDQFLTNDRSELLWDQVIVAGASHGSTTAARFAKHQKVARVVAFCGPRDQFQTWQSLPSATPENRYFGFSHVLDTGWTGDHYCRSWEMLGMYNFGPIVNVEDASPPFQNTRRLITNYDVGGNVKAAHSGVVPGNASHRDNQTNEFKHEAVWRYLFTHPVDQVGSEDVLDDSCVKNPRQ